jgi:hypothetical protein
MTTPSARRRALALAALLALPACANTTGPSCGEVTTLTLPTMTVTAQMCTTRFNPWWEQ